MNRTNSARRKKLLAFLIGSFAAVLFLFLAELAARVLAVWDEKHPQLVEYVFKPDEIREREEKIGEFGLLPPTPLEFVEVRRKFFYRKPLSGYSLILEPTEFVKKGPVFMRPVKSHRSKLIVNGNVIFDVKYSVDGYGRRVTPGEEGKTADRFLLMLGDSGVFGFGVEDDQTIAAHLGKYYPSVRVYNYGINGLIPGETLDWLRSIEGEPEVSERRGTVLYLWANSYVRRNALALSEISWASARPYYYVEESGEVVAKETIGEAWPFWSFLSRVYSRSAFLQYSGFDWPKRFTARDYEFMTAMILQIKRRSERLGANQFYVVFYPLGRASTRHGLIPYLEKAGIRYIDYGDLPLANMVKGEVRIPYDGHFTAEANEVFAREISRLKFLFEDAREPY